MNVIAKALVCAGMTVTGFAFAVDADSPRHTVDALEAAVIERDLALDAEWRAVADGAAFKRKCSAFKEDFRRALGYQGIRRTPLNAHALSVKDYGAFRIEKVMMESAPGAFVPLLVFLPDARKFAPPYAGFIFIPGHSKDGKDYPIFNYSIAYDRENKEPLFYEEYPGSIVDTAQLQIMLDKAMKV